jgi:adenosylmethionine-8-amino-7-oxononanoate aminotransferase
MSPPFVVTDQQIDQMVAVLGRAIARVEKELRAVP